VEVITELGARGRPAAGTAVTIGAFDGVHRGHQAVLAELRRLATEAGLSTTVVTFDRHPAMVVRPESAPKMLTDLDQKVEALAATGDVDATVVVPFDEARSKEDPEDFVSEVLVDGLGARLVIVGEDFHFGHRRRGNVALLRRLGADQGFDVVGLGLIGAAELGGPDGLDGPVSSTAIRRLLSAGDVAAAADLLGRNHEVRGVVAGGDRRGHDLGFPTANVVVPPEILLPAVGIYAGWYQRPDGSVHPAAISLGRRPTFHADDAPVVLEPYLLDFIGDLYGEEARVRFVARLRDEEKYDSVDALKAQMTLDVEATRRLLAAG
jgi:riboflavin kinase/FMN adenylyltransferase